MDLHDLNFPPGVHLEPCDAIDGGLDRATGTVVDRGAGRQEQHRSRACGQPAADRRWG